MNGAAAADEEPLLCWREGPVGRIELNRPRAVNALSFPMVELFIKTLRDWQDDPAIRTVVVTGAGPPRAVRRRGHPVDLP
jgi:enoyl-CoA hydratase